MAAVVQSVQGGYDYSASSDLKFDDEFVSSAAQSIAARSEELQKYTDRYVAIMNTVTNDAITAGNTSQALKKFTSLAAELGGVIEDLGSETASIAQAFIKKVNAADQKFFNG